MSGYIDRFTAKLMLDSTGRVVTGITATTRDGATAWSCVPSCQGAAGVLSLQDPQSLNDDAVWTASTSVETEITEALGGLSIHDQRDIDSFLSEVEDVHNGPRCGVNAVLGCSVAVARLAAERAGMPLFRYLGGIQANRLPVPCIPLIRSVDSGSPSGGGALYLFVPHGASSFRGALTWANEVSQSLQQLLRENGLPDNPDAGGVFILEGCPESWLPQLIAAAMQKSGLTPGHDAGLCLTPVSVPEETLYSGRQREAGYPVIIPDDGLGYDSRGIQTMFISPCHMETLSDCMDTAQLYHDQHRAVCLSCSGAQTDDTFMADLAMAARVGYLKVGLPPFAQSTGLINRLLWIEEELGSAAVFAGTRKG
ncbi:hypothetical protein [Citrobacter portucalensis]|uniref:hypothetical protein n=1 Tax=Citrobacter portucalensis TaxID=1639133 RepID=UPI001F3972D4|nr:hypothetical protein [Citrobacter portucalensis]